MSHPTEPGWYWVWGRMDDPRWEVVELQHDGKQLYISGTESDDYQDFDDPDFRNAIWGERIPEPPPPN